MDVQTVTLLTLIAAGLGWVAADASAAVERWRVRRAYQRRARPGNLKRW